MTRSIKKDWGLLRSKLFFVNSFHHFLRVIFAFVIIGLFAHPAFAKGKSTKKPTKPLPCPPKSQSLSKAPENELQDEKIQADMEKHIGIPYRWGGSGTGGFDCSGFVKHVYSEIFGIDLPRQSTLQSRLSTLEDVASENLEMGDLLFFSSQRTKKRIDHVGLYLSDGNFIHSARNRGVVISSLDSRYWKSNLAATKRLLRRDTRAEDFAFGESALALAEYVSEQTVSSLLATNTGLGMFPLSFAQEGLSTSPADGEFYRMKIDYVRFLSADSWAARLTGFLDYSLESRERSPVSSSEIMTLSESSGAAYPFSRVRGLQITNEIRSSEWLLVLPSLAYFDYGSGVDKFDRPRVMLSTSFSLTSASGERSISTGFQYPLLRYSSPNFSDNPNSNLPSLYLSYHQSLASHVQFSIFGEFSIKDSQGWSTGFSSSAETDHGRLCFAFNFLF